MPCNGLNHTPDCNCGWGGKYYGAGDALDGPYWKSEKSHTNPNAKCPVCGNLVFFYRSPDDGKVFFDALGPPWPKHACTQAPRARKPGWWPFLLDFRYDLVGREGVGIVDTSERTLLVRTKWTNFRYDTPVWLQPVSKEQGLYRVSTLVTRRGVTQDREFLALSPELLKNPVYAQHFQQTIALINSQAANSSGAA